MAGSNLPLLMAGPIVRRVDGRSASFWVALSRPARVEAYIWDGQHPSSGPGTVDGQGPVASAAATTRPYGTHLHVALVVVGAEAPGLTPGWTFSYDIVIDEGGRRQGLLALGLLSDEDASSRLDGVHDEAPRHLALGYEDGCLPTFVTPPATLAEVRLAQASCRKTNGDGPDAMAWLDDIIHDTRGAPGQRPQQLFLTGDQIYADDLAAALLPMLGGLAAELIGPQTLPVGAGAAFDGTLENFPPLRRGRAVREHARFSSTEAANHLLTFGEFAAMYLAVWSPRVWRAIASEGDVFPAVQSTPPSDAYLTDWGDAFGDEARRARFARERSDLVVFRDAVPRVARALANIATYMILDDHEVTDDWNITRSWRTAVLTAPLGRACVRNALCAYAIFQHWGNDPAALDPAEEASAGAPDRDLLDAIEAFAATPSFHTRAEDESRRAELDALLGLTSPEANPQVSWHYHVQAPCYRVHVIDSRTRRTYRGRNTYARHLGDSLDAQLPPFATVSNAQGGIGCDVLVVVSPQPVLFPRLVDALVQPAAASVGDCVAHLGGKHGTDPEGHTPSGLEERDVESWCGDEAHFEAFIERLATWKRVVILSGDVHFSSSLTLDFWRGEQPQVAARIVQFTSSSARHRPSATMRAVLRGLRFGQGLLRGQPYERLGWTVADPAPVTLPAGASIPPGRAARVRRSPTLLPALGWPAGTTVGRAPDWRWRLKVVHDVRPRSERAAAAAMPPKLEPTAGVAGFPMQRYLDVAQVHGGEALARRSSIRTMVFDSNIGVLGFETDGAMKAMHALWLENDAGEKAVPATVHEARLDLGDALDRPELTHHTST